MNDKTLPGAPILFKSARSTGHSTNGFGVGDMDISIHRPDSKYPWLDLGRINFASPTEQQLLDAQTSPAFSEGQKAFADINRRLSFKQAQLVRDIFIHTLEQAFRGEIPADDEIPDFLKQWKKDQS